MLFCMITRPNELSSVLALCPNCSKFGHIMLWLIHRLVQSIVSDEKKKLGGYAGPQDSFTRCFKSNTPEPWNWNLYLAPLWCLGVIVRYGILFPIRSLFFLFGFFSFQVFVLCSLSFVPLSSVGAVLWNLLKFSIVFIQNQCHNVYICQSVLCGFITFWRNFFWGTECCHVMGLWLNYWNQGVEGTGLCFLQ